MKIGIPRALNWYYQGRFWEEFLKNLGFEVVVSPVTNNKIVKKGIENSDINYCYTLKIYLGHVMDLKDKVDKLFIPCSVGEMPLALCSYHKALPDLVRILFPGEILTLSLTIDNENEFSEGNYISFLNFGMSLGKKKDEVEKAIKAAWEIFIKEKQDEDKKEKEKFKEKGLKIAIIGSEYVVKDKFILDPVVKILKEEGVVSVLFKTDKDYDPGFNLCWTLEKEIINNYKDAAKNKNINGIIYMAPFTCGPLFLLDDQIFEKYKNILRLKVDESQHEQRLRTRIEAFVDLLKRKKK